MSKESDDSELYDKLLNPIMINGTNKEDYDCKLYVDAYSNVVIKEENGEYFTEIASIVGLTYCMGVIRWNATAYCRLSWCNVPGRLLPRTATIHR